MSSSEGLSEGTAPTVHGTLLRASSFLKNSWASALCKWVETLLWLLWRDMRRGDEGSEKESRGLDSPRSQDAVRCGGGTGATENDEHRGLPVGETGPGLPGKPACSVFCPHPIPGLVGYFCRVSDENLFLKTIGGWVGGGGDRVGAGVVKNE